VPAVTRADRAALKRDLVAAKRSINQVASLAHARYALRSGRVTRVLPVPGRAIAGLPITHLIRKRAIAGLVIPIILRGNHYLADRGALNADMLG